MFVPTMKDTEMLLFNGIIYTKNNVNLLLFISAVHPLMLYLSLTSVQCGRQWVE